jgi:adenylylsulfate kinase
MSWAVWITGRPGSGTSAVARAAADAIIARGDAVTVLAVDDMRKLVTPAPSHTDAERDLVHRGLVYAAATLVSAGVAVIIDAAGHRREWRDLARAVIPAFAEVQLTAAAGTAGASDPGPNAPYEPAAAPELTIDTTEETVEAAAARVVDLVAGLPRPTPRAAVRWAVWITGLPGSGKTTIASRVAEALAGRGTTVQVLDLADLRAFLAHGTPTPRTEDLAHRVLVYMAKRLTDAGVAVVVDASAPARRWRDLARAVIARFAEVQLVCPAHVCATRERAVRWRLIGCSQQIPPRHALAGPDIELAYERALNPELTIHTDVEDPWSAVESVLRLAARLEMDDRPSLAR